MLTILRKTYEEMIIHCIASLPYEACGLLAGKQHITEIYKIKNIDNSSISYFMDPSEHLRAMKDIKLKNLEMIAIYHSHPYGNAFPSRKDIELAIYKVYYVIIGLKPSLKVKAFCIEDEKTEEITLRVIDDY